MNYGYTICSDNNQKEILKESGVKPEYIFIEVSTPSNRLDVFRKMQERIKKNDTIIVTDLQHLTDSTNELPIIIKEIRQKRADLKVGDYKLFLSRNKISKKNEDFLKMCGISIDDIDVSSDTDKASYHGKEKYNNKSRKEKSDVIKRKCKKYLEMGVSVTDISIITGCSRTTIHYYKNLLDKNKSRSDK